MSTKTKKTTEKGEKETDVITNDKTDTVVEIKPDAAPKSKSLIIKLEDLEPFKNHPYKVIENESMTELIDSIKEYGILNPLLVRPLEGAESKYEIISGHRRYAAAQKLGMKKVPCTVHFIDRDAATVIMVDSNCQRTELLPSEKAWAYKMKMDAMSRQGKGRIWSKRITAIQLRAHWARSYAITAPTKNWLKTALTAPVRFLAISV